jgi:plastocyanin
MRRTPLPLTLAGAAAALAITLSACGGDDGSTTDTTSASGDGGGGSALVVEAKDNLKFDKDSYEAQSGSVDITYENSGSVAHTLLIKGKSGFKLSVGSKDEGSIDLAPGTYTIYCDVAGHEAAGMHAELTVE